MPLTYPYDPTGSASSNLVSLEPHVITDQASRFFVPSAGPFFTKGLQLRKADNTLLRPGIDYKALHLYGPATMATGKEVCAVIYILNTAITGTVRMTYQCVGGDYSATVDALQQLISDSDLTGAGTFAWGNIIGAPVQFPPSAHLHHSSNVYGMSDTVTVLEGIRLAIMAGDGAIFQMVYQYIDTALANSTALGVSQSDLTNAITAAIAAHKTDSSAHTPANVGLGNVQNLGLATTAEAQAATVNNKYMTPALVKALVTAVVTKSWLGLDQVPNFPLASDTQKLDQNNDATLMSPKRVADLVNNMRPTSSSLVLSTAVEGLMGIDNTKATSPKSARESAKGLFGKLTTQTLASVDPNVVLDPVIMTTAGTNTPEGGIPYLILTFFDRTVDTAISASTPRMQVAIRAQVATGAAPAGTGMGIARRYFDGSAWTAWASAVNQADFGLGNLFNYGIASDIEAWEGASTTKYMTPKQSAMTAKGTQRHVGTLTTKDPNTVMDPVVFSVHSNCPTGSIGAGLNNSFLIFTTFQCVNATDVPQVSGTDRMQVAYGRNVSGIWKRDSVNGTWSSWTSADDNTVDRIWANANLDVSVDCSYEGVVNCSMAGDGIAAAVIRRPDSTACLAWSHTKGNSWLGTRDANWGDGSPPVFTLTTFPSQDPIAIALLDKNLSQNRFTAYILHSDVTSVYTSGSTNRSTIAKVQPLLNNSGGIGQNTCMWSTGKYAIMDIAVTSEIAPPVGGNGLGAAIVRDLVSNGDTRVFFTFNGVDTNNAWGIPATFTKDGTVTTGSINYGTGVFSEGTMTAASYQLAASGPYLGLGAGTNCFCAVVNNVAYWMVPSLGGGGQITAVTIYTQALALPVGADPSAVYKSMDVFTIGTITYLMVATQFGDINIYTFDAASGTRTLVDSIPWSDIFAGGSMPTGISRVGYSKGIIYIGVSSISGVFEAFNYIYATPWFPGTIYRRKSMAIVSNGSFFQGRRTFTRGRFVSSTRGVNFLHFDNCVMSGKVGYSGAGM